MHGFDRLGSVPSRMATAARTLPYSPAANALTAGGGGPSLRELARRRLWDELLGGVLGVSDGAGVVMLVDAVTMRILSSLFRLSELTDAGVHVVENVTMRSSDGKAFLRRQPLPQLHAVYFLTPSVESVNRLIDDFRDPMQPKYTAAHLYFSSRVSKSLVAKLRASAAMPRVRTFREVLLDFVAAESNVFTLGGPDAFRSLFRADSAPEVTTARLHECHRLASSLATLCATLGLYPTIHYRAGCAVAEAVAAATQEKLDALLGADGPAALRASAEAGASRAEAERPLLLILDRTFDPLSPLLHEFSYLAMANDLLPVTEDARYTYAYTGNSGKTLSKEVLLNESDPLLVKYRHMHIADLTGRLDSDYKAFLKQNEASAALGQGGANLKAMAEGLRAMPKFQAAMGRWSLHIALTTDLLGRYGAYGLEAVALLEQGMACGEGADGEPFRDAEGALRALLTEGEAGNSPVDRMRLLMVHAITSDGIAPETRRQLVDLAGIGPEDQVAILNLSHLGVNMTKGATDRSRPARERGGARPRVGSGEGGEDEGYDVSRYEPPLRRLAEALLAGSLSRDSYPSLRGKAGASLPARSVASEPVPKLASWAAAEGSELSGFGAPAARPASSYDASSLGRTLSPSLANSFGPSATMPPLLVFVAGGVTHGEVRELHALATLQRRDIFLGSTGMLTPQRYILGLKGLQTFQEPAAPPCVQQRA